ncbi:MAG: T9SS type A sorting domain-containing protein, partial [Gemmatimonadaceae bacterium]|nr:T9SS type A sorting domain-containing protein [Chitinophagaceae bacterium]
NINFNPIINFPGTGTNQLIAEQGFSRLGTHNGLHTFTVLAPRNTVAETASFLRETNATPVGESNGMVNIFTPTTVNVSFEAGSATPINRVTTPYVPAEIGQPLLFSFSKDVTNNTPNGNKQDIRKNGLLMSGIDTGTTFTGDRSSMTIGSDGTNTLNARVAEIIYMLDGALSASEQGRIESYLALKYGISLGSNASPSNYLSSNGTIYWNGLAAYQYDVFGIGRDDVTLLSQLQSNSVNSGSGDGTGQNAKGNLVLGAASLTNNQFLVIGHNNDVLVETTIQNGQAPLVTVGSRRLPRNWKVRNTGAVGGVNLSIDRTGLVFTGGNIVNNYRLMIDNDGDGNYTTGTQTFIAPASVTATKVSFTGITLPNNAVFTLITLLVGSASLPVDMTEFKVIKQGEKAVLSWTTASEINNKYFEVEHSTDGLNWTKIGTVNSLGNSNAERQYSFTHNVPVKGINYYRLKQVDIDDKFKVSIVKSVIFGKSLQLIVYPNPTKGRVVIQSGEVLKSISVYNMAGQRLIQEQPTGATSGTVYEINVSSLARGIYILQLVNADGTVRSIKLEKEQ